jgi:hypothetical protein
VRSVRQTNEFVSLDFEDGSEEAADLVIGADGVGSVVRQAVTGESSQSYAGYVAWRGLLPESTLPAESAAQLLDRFAFYMMQGSHILGYTVTGPNAETERGARRYNWVWYRRISEGEFGKVLTDAEGRVHPYSLAPGELPDGRRQALIEDAARLLPPPFAAAVAAERQPFVRQVRFAFEPPKPDFPIGRYTCPEGRGTRAISDNFNGAVYRVTCDGASVGRWFLDIESRNLRPGQASEDRRIMATCREQHKNMPDRVVKAQALPDMKERTKRVENAPDREKP